jgi:hypothetical protein
MPQNYTGSTAGITARQDATISEPVDTDVRNSNSVRTPLRALTDLLHYLSKKAGLIDQLNTWTQKQTMSGGIGGLPMPSVGTDVASAEYAQALIASLKTAVNTWTAKQTMSGGVGGLPAPSALADAATKSYADDLITTLKAFANTWAGKQTFGAGMLMTSGFFDMTQLNEQGMAKTGGPLMLKTLDGQEIGFVTNNVLRAAFQTTGNLWLGANRIVNLADPQAASDGATKGYVDGRTTIPSAWAPVTVSAPWDDGGNAGSYGAVYSKSTDGMVTLRFALQCHGAVSALGAALGPVLPVGARPAGANGWLPFVAYKKATATSTTATPFTAIVQTNGAVTLDAGSIAVGEFIYGTVTFPGHQ